MSSIDIIQTVVIILIILNMGLMSRNNGVIINKILTVLEMMNRKPKPNDTRDKEENSN